MLLIASLAVIVFTSIVIMYASDPFEESADFLGRNMSPGTKGATINAIGSSLPELFTTLILLFGPAWAPNFFGDQHDGFSAGIATCAGSAVFNAVVIPGLCILAVMFYGVKRKDGTLEKVQHIALDKKVVLKDGLFFVGAELLLIYFLGDSHMVWWMGALMAAFYVVYVSVTLGFGFSMGDDDDEDDDDEEGDGDDDEQGSVGILGLGWLLDFNNRFFGGKELNDTRAWLNLAAAVVTIALACAGIAWAVEHSAEALGVQPYFTAVILAAAATSVPDTVLSVKDAIKGQYDDAVANAVGSNIFDICVGLGVPLLLYGLIMGPVELAAAGSAADVQLLRWVLLGVTAVVLTLFLTGKSIGRGKAVILFSLYFGWLVFVVLRGTGVLGDTAPVEEALGALPVIESIVA